MKNVFIYLLGSVLLYSFFSELDAVKMLLIFFSLGAAYLIYRVPARHIVAMKYPFIFLSFAVAVFFLIYPAINIQYPVDGFIVFISFYGLTFYLITIEEKGKGLFKEATALSVVFLSSAFNLSMIGKPLLVFPMAIAAMFFLFIVSKKVLIPFLAGYTLVIMFLIFNKGASMFGSELIIGDVQKYLLLIASFILLSMGFIRFVKKSNFIKLLSFFGFLYIATDVFMVLNFRLSTGLLYQPVAALLVLAPLIGIMLKPEKERT